MLLPRPRRKGQGLLLPVLSCELSEGDRPPCAEGRRDIRPASPSWAREIDGLIVRTLPKLCGLIVAIGDEVTDARRTSSSREEEGGGRALRRQLLRAA